MIPKCGLSNYSLVYLKGSVIHKLLFITFHTPLLIYVFDLEGIKMNQYISSVTV